MRPDKKEHPKEKTKLHPRNKHRERYDLKLLVSTLPELEPFVTTNIHGDETVDFFNPEAVKLLNKALLKQYYGIDYWDIPPMYLCPPIPGRADYLHNMADILSQSNKGQIPNGNKLTCLDVGVGANCVYPIIGNKSYGWSFIGSDTDPAAVASAKNIVEKNPHLAGQIDIRLQPDPKHFFRGIIGKDEYVDLTICNPPFHASAEDAAASNQRKVSNLTKTKTEEPQSNFGGQANELWYEGGEKMFVGTMIMESKHFAKSVFWFSTLISKQSNLKMAYAELDHIGATEIKTIPMGQGNKSSRVVAWTFFSPAQTKAWVEGRWQK